jgi:arginase
VSRLRARCPDCRTLTAVAVGPEYECHSCGRQFAAGLVRVPRAWGEGGQAMERAAHLALPYPETGVVEEETLAAQSAALAADLPERPLVLGGCCCAHVGAVEGLAVRPGGRLAVVWLDAHGDLNTVESSPTGNLWATPLRLLVDSGAVVAEDVALVGARNLDPPELEFMAAHGIDDDLGRALAGVDRVYVAVDTDVLRPGELAMFMPEPGGPTLDEVEATLRRVAALAPVAGAGITAFLDDPANQAALARLAAAALQPVTR